jgi:twitching motility two-component system response regulator PilH
MDPLRILVVEPDAAERSRLGTVVQAVAKELDTTARVDEASDGTTALALCSDHRFDLVLSEVVLEGLSGLALLRALRGSRDDAPAVVLVTTMARETDRYWGLRNGALAYFAKPYEEAALRERLVRALETDGPAKPDRLVRL